MIIRESNANSAEGWDSFVHLSIVASVQKHYGIRFALGELQELKDAGEMMDLIQSKLAAKA